MSFTGERFVPELRGQIYYEHLHRYAISVPLATGKDVLDIASGEGYGAAFLAMTARSVVGVDIDANSIQHAAARYAAMNLTFRVGSATQIPLSDASVDVITSFETLEHLAEHEQMLREFDRVLRSDGKLVISSPNKLVYSDNRDYANPYHVRELYFNEFRELLQRHFGEVHMYGQRVFAACGIYPTGTRAAKTRWVGPSISSANGMPGLSEPEYFVAVCARAPGAKLPDLSTVYLDPRDDLLNDIRMGGLAADAEHTLRLPGGESAPLAISGSPAAKKTAAREHINTLEAQFAEQVAATEANAHEAERLERQCFELERLRSEQYERAERATSEASRYREEAERVEQKAHEHAALVESFERELRRRDAEISLMRDRHAEELQEITERFSAEMNASRNEFDRIQLRAHEAGVELLLIRLTNAEAALTEALRVADATRLELDATRSSHSWHVTAPLRKAVSLMRS